MNTEEKNIETKSAKNNNVSKLKIRNLLFAYNILYTIAGSMVSSFSLIYIYNLSNSIAYAISYMMLLLGCSLFGVLIFRKLYEKNPAVFLVASILIVITSQIFMLTSPFANVVTIVVVGILNGLASSCHYVPYNIILSTSCEKKIGKSMNKEKTGTFIAKLITPILGGGLFAINHYVSLRIAVMLYAVSTVPIFVGMKTIKSLLQLRENETEETSEEKNDTVKISSKHPMFWFCSFFLCVGVKDLISGVIWPLYLAINNISYLSFGILSSVSTLGIFITDITSNYFFDKNRWKTIAVVSVVMSSVCFILRFFFVGTVALYILTFAMSLFDAYFSNPMFNQYIGFSKVSNQYSKNMSIREYCINGVKFVPSLLFIVLPFFMPFMIVCSVAYVLMIVPILKIK